MDRRNNYYCTDHSFSANIVGHVANLFPKYVRAKNCRTNDGEGGYDSTYIQISFSPVKGNPENEAGLKRLRKFLQVCETNGIQLVEGVRCLNSISLAERLGNGASVEAPVPDAVDGLVLIAEGMLARLDLEHDERSGLGEENPVFINAAVREELRASIAQVKAERVRDAEDDHYSQQISDFLALNRLTTKDLYHYLMENSPKFERR